MIVYIFISGRRIYVNIGIIYFVNTGTIFGDDRCVDFFVCANIRIIWRFVEIE